MVATATKDAKVLQKYAAPLEFSRENLIYLNAVVRANERETSAKFLVDTGSPFSYIINGRAADLGINTNEMQKLGEFFVATGASGTRYRGFSGELIVNDIDGMAQSVKFEHLPVSVFNDAGKGTGLLADGVIGTDFLAAGRMHLLVDIFNKSASMSRGELADVIALCLGAKFAANDKIRVDLRNTLIIPLAISPKSKKPYLRGELAVDTTNVEASFRIDVGSNFFGYADHRVISKLGIDVNTLQKVSELTLMDAIADVFKTGRIELHVKAADFSGKPTNFTMGIPQFRAVRFRQKEEELDKILTNEDGQLYSSFSTLGNGFLAASRLLLLMSYSEDKDLGFLLLRK